MWIGSAISELGGAFGTLCNSILVYELTGSEMALSSMWLFHPITHTAINKWPIY